MLCWTSHMLVLGVSGYRTWRLYLHQWLEGALGCSLTLQQLDQGGPHQCD